jgi:hypothetical protein
MAIGAAPGKRGAAHAQSFAVDTQGCQQVIEEFLQQYGQP